MRKADSNQVARNIAYLIWDKAKKIEQLDKVQGITMNCTSDDHINVVGELHHGNIVRYLIEGTRSRMTITADTSTREMLRLPRGSQALHRFECDMWCSDIQKWIEKWKNN